MELLDLRSPAYGMDVSQNDIPNRRRLQRGSNEEGKGRGAGGAVPAAPGMAPWGIRLNRVHLNLFPSIAER